MVFIVDDSKGLRERLADMVSEINGIAVLGQAGSAAEAIDGIRTLKPRVVILDIQMPGGSGLEVLRTIKQESHPPVVVMLTNHAYPQYRERCMGLGAGYFLDKSREFERLVEIFQLLAESL
ncbi:MAG: response regulator transcription factor [Acidobacteriota bacterium]|nr:response regulator transcription factor [Acidobacteriota bacterium]MDQ5835475.1 response regulator transcription factor [Acidobacteriota bacterium]